MSAQSDSTSSTLDELCLAGQDAYAQADLVGATRHWQAALTRCVAPASNGDAAVQLTRAHLLTNLGVVLHENYDCDLAEDMLLLALEAYGDLAPDAISPSDRAGFIADVHVNLGMAWNALGHPNDAEDLVVDALKAYDSLIRQGHDEWCLSRTLARANLGKLQADRYWLKEADAHLQESLKELEERAASGDTLAPMQVATVMKNCGISLFRSGRLVSAAEQLTHAYEMLQAQVKQCPDVRLRIELARTASALANFRPDFFRVNRHLDPVAEFQRLSKEGTTHLMHDLAIAHIAMVRVEPTQDGVFEHLFSAIDLLTALRRCGNYFVIRDLGLAYGRLCSELWSTWAVHSGLKAQAIGLRLTKILAGNGNAQADYLLAHMLKNAGGPMADLGREATAVRLFMQSAEGFNQLQSRVSPSSLVRLFECKSLCNAGTALCRLDQYDRASRLVNLIDEIHERDPAVGEIGRERAMAPQFLKLSATVASGLGDRIRAQSMLDQSVQDLAKASGLKGTFWGGMAFWPTLANHTGAAIVNAWAAACDSSHKAKIDLPTQALLFTSASKALEVMQLLPALMPRADSLHAGKVAADLVAGLGWLAELGMVNSPLNWISIRSDFARLTVDLVGNWLRKALPEDLHSTEPVIELILHRLTGALVAIDDTALIAHGFLSSQGLRSQHLAWHGASAAADAARVWHEIDELDRAGLGSLDRQGQMASFPLGLDASWLDATALSSSQRREQRRALLGNLFQAGTAEPPVPLDLATVQQRLPRGQALLMLLRAASGLLVVVVTCDTSGALGLRHVCLALAPGASADCRLDLSLVDLGLLQEQAGAVRKAPIRDAGCTRGVAREDESSKDVDTVAAHSRLALLASALTPTLSELMRQGFTLCLIPSGDLHVLPWHHFVQHQCGDAQALRVFATVTDWWRLHDPESPVNGAEEPPRWLMAAYDAHDTGDLADRLCWVPVEASLSGSLWTSAHLRAVDPQSEIRPQADAIEANALLACGHSLAPGGNAALAGVWVGTVRSQGAASRIPQVLSARDLKQVPSVRRLLLSCCVLGRTDGVFGEPLGLIAQAFNHGAEFALGSLVQLGDMEATLFSLAYQWSLSQAYAQSPCVNVDWVHVFVQVQTQIGQGRWPEGFGDWLGQHLPGVLGSVIPSVEAARTQDQAWELRQSWQRILGSLCSDWDLPAPPQASRTLAPTICAVARVLAKSPSARLSRLATWMVVYGVGEQRVRPR